MAIIKKYSPEFLIIVILTFLLPLVTFPQLKAALHITEWLNALFFLVFIILVSYANYRRNKHLTLHQILKFRLLHIGYFVIYLVILKAVTIYLDEKNLISGWFFWVMLSVVFLLGIVEWVKFSKKV